MAAVIAVQSLHHLRPETQRAAFRFAAAHLVPGGALLVLDRIAIDTRALRPVYAAMWARLEAAAAAASGWSPERFFARLQDSGDHPARPDEVVAWMRAAGLQAACVHLHLNRALFVGVRPAP